MSLALRPTLLFVAREIFNDAFTRLYHEISKKHIKRRIGKFIKYYYNLYN